MLEVIFVHWIVVCIVEIIYPNCSIWIYIYFFFITEVDSECIRIVALSCSSFLVNPNILKVQFTNVDQTLIVKPLFWWIIQSVNCFSIIHIWILIFVPNQFNIPVQFSLIDRIRSEEHT